jgi:hypothetical protein
VSLNGALLVSQRHCKKRIGLKPSARARLGTDLLSEVPARLDGGLPIGARQEVVRLLVGGIAIHHNAGPRGRRASKCLSNTASPVQFRSARATVRRGGEFDMPSTMPCRIGGARASSPDSLGIWRVRKTHPGVFA